jgi:hypothetical protein
MPWCDECDRWMSPNALCEDGSCPTCGRGVGKAGPADVALAEEEVPKVPWHFWVLVASAAIYLIWRAIEAIVWLAGRF